MKITIASGDYGFMGDIPDDLFALGTDLEFTIRGRVIDSRREEIDVTPSSAHQRQTIEGERIITIRVNEINGSRLNP